MAYTGSEENATISTTPMVDQASLYHFSSSSDSDTPTFSSSSSSSSFSSYEKESFPSSANVIFPKKRSTKKLSSKKKKPLSCIDKILFLTRPLLIVVIVILFLSLIVKGNLDFSPFSAKIDISKSPPGPPSSSSPPTAPPSSPKPKKIEVLDKSDPRSPKYVGIYSFLIGYKEDMTAEQLSAFKNELNSRCLNPLMNGDINLPCATGSPLVHAVVAKYPLDIIEMLVKHGACICKTNGQGNIFSSPSLVYAILLSRWDVVEYFLSFGDQFLDLTVRTYSHQSVAEFLIITCSGYDVPPLIKENILRRTKDQLIRAGEFGLKDMLLYKEFTMFYSQLKSEPNTLTEELKRPGCRYSILAIAFWVGASDDLVAKILDHDPNIVVDWNLYQEDSFFEQCGIGMETFERKDDLSKIIKPPGLDDRVEKFKELYIHLQTLNQQAKSRRGSIVE